jgi:hypothetical protein
LVALVALAALAALVALVALAAEIALTVVCCALRLNRSLQRLICLGVLLDGFWRSWQR